MAAWVEVDGSTTATGMLIVFALQLRDIDGVAQQHQGIRFAQRTCVHWAKPTCRGFAPGQPDPLNAGLVDQAGMATSS